MMQTIGIDCRLAGDRHAGLGRYTAQLVRHLIEDRPSQQQFILFFSDEEQADQVLSGHWQTVSEDKTIKIRYTSIRHYTIAEQLILPWVFWKERLDLLHVPHFNAPILYPGQMVLTIHDLLWHEKRGSAVTTLPSWQYWLKYLLYRLVSKVAIFRAAHILVPTEAIQSTLAAYYPATVGKITVTKEGTTLPAASPKQVPARDPYQILYVGSLYPHKNVRLVLHGLRLLDTRYHLRIIGARNIFQETFAATVEQLGLDDRVTFSGYVSDNELAAAYQQAGMLVMPSLSEGFGLPGIEALSFGTPVIASDIPVFREVYDPFAQNIDPHSVEAFVTAVAAVNTLPANWKKEAIRFASQYDWKAMTEKTAAVYASVLQQ